MIAVKVTQYKQTLESTRSLTNYVQFLIDQDVTKGKVYLTQNQAHKRFGRSNVERWASKCKIKRYYRGEKVVEYKMSELLEAATIQQDCDL